MGIMAIASREELALPDLFRLGRTSKSFALIVGRYHKMKKGKAATLHSPTVINLTGSDDNEQIEILSFKKKVRQRLRMSREGDYTC